MRDQSRLNEKRISWLMDHSHLWYDEDEMVDVEWEMDEIKKKMRASGLYDPLTRNSSMNIRPLINKARKRLDREEMDF